MQKLFTPKTIATQPNPNHIISVIRDYTLEVCLSKASRRAAYRLRYRAYLDVGAISENREKLLYDHYDQQPNAHIFLVWYQGKPVATMRSCAYAGKYDWSPLESHHYFCADLHDQLGPWGSFQEANRFAVDPSFQGRKSLFAKLLLFRAHGINAALHRSEHVVILVREHHQAFYQKFFDMECISDEPYYVKWANAYVYLLSNRTDVCREKILQKGMPDYDEQDIADFARLIGQQYEFRHNIAA